MLTTILFPLLVLAAEPVRVGLVDTGVANHKQLRPFTKGLGYDFVRGRHSQVDEDGHGSHLAGVLTLNNNPQTLQLYSYRYSVGRVVSTSPEAKLKQDQLDEKLYLQALRQAKSDRLQVLNLSLTHPQALPEEEAIFRDLENSTLIVVASGNDRQDLDETPLYPCAYELENVLCVGSAGSKEVSSFSNYGSRVLLYVPGETVVGFSPDPKELLTTMSGSSQATAVVSRWVAELSRKFPQASPVELKQMLLKAKSGVFLRSLDQVGQK